MDCIFCKIAQGKIPAKKVFEDETAVAFHDLNPQAPTHVLIIPKEHLAGVEDAQVKHSLALGHLWVVAAAVGRQLGLTGGYRLVVNQGVDAGQSVMHLHVHLLGGRPLAWPPG